MITIENSALIKSIESINPDILTATIAEWRKQDFNKLQPFITEHYWNSNASINIFRVKGTQHPDYMGMSWIELLHKGKRMSLNLGLFESNPQYYYTTDLKEPKMHYQSLDGGDLYVASDGNHRTAIAKAAFYLDGTVMLHGVTIDDYKIDWELKKIYDELQGLIMEHNIRYFVEPVSMTVSREDSSGWMLEKYSVQLKVRNILKQSESLMSSSDASEFLETLKKRSRFINKVKQFFFNLI